jgi:hypothetical protein
MILRGSKLRSVVVAWDMLQGRLHIKLLWHIRSFKSPAAASWGAHRAQWTGEGVGGGPSGAQHMRSVGQDSPLGGPP